jgi:uncharacterized repeat protein (TIGR03803 family)
MHPNRMLLLLTNAIGAFLLATSAGAAPSGYRVVHAFGVDAAPRLPFARVVADAAGVLYGAAQEGGGHLLGAIYAFDPDSGNASVLYAFGGNGVSAGEHPTDELVSDSAGNLYGTTQSGGSGGLGTVFKIDAGTHALTVLHVFTGGSDGAIPSGGLVIDPRDNLFGTTLVGGASDCGTVYRVSRRGAETQVYAFGGTQASSGCLPTSALALDSAGNLYGTTMSGGARGRGTVYQLTPGTASSPTRYTVLHRFLGGADGNLPLGGVVLDAAQTQLYGTTSEGGTWGQGTVFACAVDGRSERVIYAFKATGSGDGGFPTGPLAIDDAGVLYGTTRTGGIDDRGTVFTLDPSSGAESVLHRFAGPAAGDGEDPSGGVLVDAAGELVGTTPLGGSDNTGTIFELPR